MVQAKKQEPRTGRPELDAAERENLERAGRALARIRDATRISQRDITRMTNGRLIAQQVSKLEKGRVERPSLRDAAELAKLYHLTPNDIAALYGYWTPDPSQPAPLDPRVRRVVEIGEALPGNLREKLYNQLHVAAVLVETEAALAAQSQ